MFCQKHPQAFLSEIFPTYTNRSFPRRAISWLFRDPDLCSQLTMLHVMLWLRHRMETFSALLAFVRGIHRSLVNSPQKGQWRGGLMFSLICAWINGWLNNRDAGDLRRHRAHCDVIVIRYHYIFLSFFILIIARLQQIFPLRLYFVAWLDIMMTSSNGNIFRVTGPLCGEFTGHRWIPITKAIDAELWCFLWSPPEQSVE